MSYILDDEFTQHLLSQPETGMGYQIIEATEKSPPHNTHTFTVYNAAKCVKQLISPYYVSEETESQPPTIYFSRYSNIKIQSPLMLLSESIQEPLNSAKDNPLRNANGIDVFVRLSAYEQDIRIDLENNCLLPGTYTTTEEDYTTCKEQQKNPIEYYALPNNENRQWAFFIQPATKDTYSIGTVQPANNHDGGGCEAYFAKGTRPNTYKGKQHYDYA